ncbi:uncharacterized protein J3R85_004435 [Psidium guajava]|nr:uncharacterized protein J3R85_004435 [Psidium guajava]
MQQHLQSCREQGKKKLKITFPDPSRNLTAHCPISEHLSSYLTEDVVFD